MFSNQPYVNIAIVILNSSIIIIASLTFLILIIVDNQLDHAQPRPKGDIKSTLEAARQRRLAMEQRSSKEVELVSQVKGSGVDGDGESDGDGDGDGDSNGDGDGDD